MNTTQLENQVRILLGETTAQFFTDVEVIDQINRVTPAIAMEFSELLTYCEITTTASTGSYQLPSDFLTVKHVELERSATLIDELVPLDVSQMWLVKHGNATEEQVPRYYKIELGSVKIDDTNPIPGDITLHPIPDDNGAANYILRIRYYQDGSTALATGTTETSLLPRYLHEAIAFRAAQNLQYKNKDIAMAREMEVQFEKNMVKARSFRNVMNRQGPQHVKDIKGYTLLDDDL